MHNASSRGRFNVLVACNAAAMSSKLREGLSSLGFDCSLSQLVSLDSVQTVVAASDPGLTTIVVFGSPTFSSVEVSQLKQLHVAGRERVKIVAVGASLGSADILEIIRSGAVDYLDAGTNYETELRALVERLESELDKPSRIGRLFTLIGPAGGSGATLLSVNLAALLAQKKKDCILLDLQLRGGDSTTLLRISPKYTVASLASKAQHLDAAMFEQSLVAHECGLRLLASPEPGRRARAAGARGLCGDEASGAHAPSHRPIAGSL